MISAECVRALFLVIAGIGPLTACVSNQASEEAPGQVAVQGLPPLAVPPDFPLLPPQKGEPRPAESAKLGQTLDVLFGAPSQRSQTETDIIEHAGPAAPGIRSSVGDLRTYTVAKGRVTRTILAAPERDGQVAQASVEG